MKRRENGKNIKRKNGSESKEEKKTNTKIVNDLVKWTKLSREIAGDEVIANEVKNIQSEIIMSCCVYWANKNYILYCIFM